MLLFQGLWYTCRMERQQGKIVKNILCLISCSPLMVRFRVSRILERKNNVSVRVVQTNYTVKMSRIQPM